MIIKIAPIFIFAVSAFVFAILRFMYTQEEYSDKESQAFIRFLSLCFIGLDLSTLFISLL